MCLGVNDVIQQNWNEWRKELPEQFHDTTIGLYDLDTRANVYKNGESIAAWQIDAYPGIRISSNAWVRHEYRNLGLGRKLAEFRVRAFRMSKMYEDCSMVMICSVSLDNTRQMDILQDIGWEQDPLHPTIWRIS